MSGLVFVLEIVVLALGIVGCVVLANWIASNRKSWRFTVPAYTWIASSLIAVTAGTVLSVHEEFLDVWFLILIVHGLAMIIIYTKGYGGK